MTNDADDIVERVNVAGEALDGLADGTARRAADAIGAAFRIAGGEIEDALVKAARTGELSFGALAESVGREMSGLALDRFVRAPLGGAIDGVLSGAGRMAASAAGAVTVNLNVPSGAPDMHRSGAQIAAAAGRAAARAMRRL